MKIEKIRPKKPSIQQKEAYSKDVKVYLNQRKKFAERKCPGCNSLDGEKFTSHESFNFDRCKSCFTVFMNPGPTHEMIEKFYKTSANYEFWSKVIYPNSRESRRETLHKQRSNFIIDAAEKYLLTDSIQNVLEIGAGTGDTLSVLAQSLKVPIDTCAIEPNLSMHEALKKNGIAPVESIMSLHGKKFDIVIAFEVLEHFLEPTDFFKICNQTLKKNGLVVLSTPNAYSLEVQALRDFSTTIDIEHISILTPPAIHNLAIRNGFQVLEIATPGKFDIELLEEASVKLDVQIKGKRMLNRNLQNLIGKFGISSHMKVILRANN